MRKSLKEKKTENCREKENGVVCGVCDARNKLHWGLRGVSAVSVPSP